MKILYSDSTACPLPTLKRLILLADQLAFTDRPSVNFENRGTIGMKSPLRGAIADFAKCGIQLDVYSPPAGAAEDLHLPYINSDIDDLEFRRIILEGFKTDPSFNQNFVALDAQYASIGRTEDPGEPKLKTPGRDLITAIVNDPEMASFDLYKTDPFFDPYRIDTQIGKAATLRVFMESISIQVTSSMLVAAQADYMTLCDSPTMARLIDRRLIRFNQPDNRQLYTAPLGLEILKAVIPDEVLQQIDVDAVFEYRSEAKEAYTAWSTDVNRISVKLESLPPEKVQSEMQNIIRTEIIPKVVEYRGEMENIAEKMFGGLIKRASTIALPTLAAVQYANVGIGEAIIAAASFLAPSVVDYLNDNQKIRRRYATAYVIDLVRNHEG